MFRRKIKLILFYTFYSILYSRTSIIRARLEHLGHLKLGTLYGIDAHTSATESISELSGLRWQILGTGSLRTLIRSGKYDTWMILFSKLYGINFLYNRGCFSIVAPHFSRDPSFVISLLILVIDSSTHENSNPKGYLIIFAHYYMDFSGCWTLPTTFVLFMYIFVLIFMSCLIPTYLKYERWYQTLLICTPWDTWDVWKFAYVDVK